MAEEVFRYRLWCETEEAFKFVWASNDDPVPTLCPTNTEHTIDETKTCIVDTVKTEDPVDVFGKVFSHETTRPPTTTTRWFGEGDDTTDPTKLGGGEYCINHHEVGGDQEESKYIDFNLKENAMYVHEAYLQFENAAFDYVFARVVPKITASSAGSGTNFNLYGGYLIIPAAGDGTLVVDPGDMVLVESPIDQNTGIRKAGYWNADYSAETHTFSNITAAPNGDGMYNMFGVEVNLNEFYGKVPMLGSGHIWLQSADAHEIGCNMRVKLTFGTYGTDHDWKCALIVVAHRART